jgi:uncharacterized protein (DUF58 family)
VQLHPTRTAVDLTFTAIGVLAIGAFLDRAPLVAFSGALLLGLMIARAVTLLAVARVRSAGFEMVWQQNTRHARVGSGQPLTLHAEVRNRDDRAARYVGLRSLHSPHLSVTLEPEAGEVPAGGRLLVNVQVTASRVGRHGLYGLSLEVRGGPGLYEVPLTFSNPFGVEVLPRSYATVARPPRGGRSRSRAESGRPGPYAQGQYDLRELRDYQAGDPFKRIAWKATARRGRLMVREFELEERDVVWLVLDASVELWSGLSGKAPLDYAIEQLASVAENELQQRNRVGLAVLGSRRLAWLRPDHGPAHSATILEALSFAVGCHDSDRSGLDESEVALRVLEHLRPLDPAEALHIGPSDLDQVAQAAGQGLKRAPFRIHPPLAPSAREQHLRRYLAAFGLDSPARLEPDRSRTDQLLLQELKRMLQSKPRPDRIVVCSPLPDPQQQAPLLAGLAALPHRGTRIGWLPMRLDRGLDDPQAQVTEQVRFALELTARNREQAGTRALGALGIRALLLRSRPRIRPSVAADESPPPQAAREPAA